MAKLHFFYSTMNAGKSTSLLQSNHNYLESNLDTIIFLPDETNKSSKGQIVSRIGLKAKAVIADKDFNFIVYIKKNKTSKLSCILIDEAQFLSKIQIRQLGEVADKLNIPVMCYGIRTDFRGELFEGSSELLALADNLIELKTICYDCGRKATMVVRIDKDGGVVTEGSKIQIGGNDQYTPVCRKHFRKRTKLI
ncbi:thymidine kinase [Gammaproteobacteria bacterium]|nr:thymidine kinase [Gammaproteobacteria bacterium]MDA7702738.1 thymidine kinase [Gammaproteobacteria bacterium]MDA7709733.1 thymidine kinase [Gammaproteobacteria bacterium]MDA7735066.1 thymidine kinase [Gammaproteobacteria bacterium]MDA7821182.1 thymidine kinase [Gammaproteobacteria bacterium]|tara:strand:+ start:584 stop:1165 length:582 start_codon:yes stop_codon:yes gene_type:complete